MITYSRTIAIKLQPIFKRSLIVQARQASVVAKKLNDLTNELPLHDCIKFSKHEKIWTHHELKGQSEALASGWADWGCKPGDAIAIWLPEYVEKVACQMAAAIGGFKIVIVDPTLGSVENFEKVLSETNPKLVIVEGELSSNLKKAIPEMEYYADHFHHSGRPFRSRKYTNLRFCVHTGFDTEPGFYFFRNMLLYDPDVSPLHSFQALIKDDTPLSMTFNEKNGKMEAGPIVSHKDVISAETSWDSIKKILNNEFVEL
mmetsp:Transcript_17148/g.25379  ORF Transcript_17148/g.25379 Transcript_17148/m.25379 type:complete len:258 (-) Transcript_17148:2-775(-)